MLHINKAPGFLYVQIKLQKIQRIYKINPLPLSYNYYIID